MSKVPVSRTALKAQNQTTDFTKKGNMSLMARS